MGAFTITPVIASQRIVPAGGMVVINAEFINESGALANPGTSIQIRLDGPTGATLQALTGMTNVTTGKYKYAYATVTSTPPGEYKVFISCVDGGNTSKFESQVGDRSTFVVI